VGDIGCIVDLGGGELTCQFRMCNVVPCCAELSDDVTGRDVNRCGWSRSVIEGLYVNLRGKYYKDRLQGSSTCCPKLISSQLCLPDVIV